jgi:hypothetical protein
MSIFVIANARYIAHEANTTLLFVLLVMYIGANANLLAVLFSPYDSLLIREACTYVIKR